MTKKRAKFYLVGMISAIGLTPWFLSVASSKNPMVDPRAHYLSGLSQIAGFLGADRHEFELLQSADRIYRKRIVISYGPLTKEEAGLFGYRRGTERGGIWSYEGLGEDPGTGFYKAVIRKGQKDRFFALLEEVRMELRIAAQLDATIVLATHDSVTLQSKMDGREHSFSLDQFLKEDHESIEQLRQQMASRVVEVQEQEALQVEDAE